MQTQSSSRKHIAVLIIDAQTALLEPEEAYRAGAIVSAIKDLLVSARKRGVPIVFMQHDGDAGSWIGQSGWEIHPALRPHSGEPLLE